MTAKRRVIWLTDEEWAKVQERAKAFDLNVSGYIRKLIEWRQPGPIYIETGERGMDPLEAVAETVRKTVPNIPVHVGPPRAFRPVPKPSQRK